jgi:hypothetical protein
MNEISKNRDQNLVSPLDEDPCTITIGFIVNWVPQRLLNGYVSKARTLRKEQQKILLP